MAYQKKLADAIRVLSMDAVQQANSGHPGMPMGMADLATVLWLEFLQHNPGNPHWSNRDRFILSNGHGSMLHYALLHLTGYALSCQDLQQFRQLHSKTPGHPEIGITPGIETTTGPLAQGFANAVGMALAERCLAAQFNRPNYPIVDHYTYVFLGDGCLMEGLSHEAASLAGCLGLGKLIAFWDNNQISIDGDVQGWFKDNTAQRFTAYHWHVIPDIDGHDPQQIQAAIRAARAVTDKPSLLCCRTQLAYGAPNVVGQAAAHGAPLGQAEVAAAKHALNWPYAPFEIPTDIYQAWDQRQPGAELEAHWQQQWQAYQQAYPALASEYQRRLSGQLPSTWQLVSEKMILNLANQPPAPTATRKASQHCLNVLAPLLPELLGGSADLSESNLTLWQDAQAITADTATGNYLHYGVREFAMAALMNGMALHGGFIPYGGTFLVFSDYARPAIRLAALMQQRVIFVLTHDSIGLGEDGPTHQPIEHISSLRAIPGLTVWRPCDAVETAVAWQQALMHTGPSCLLLSRQALTPPPRATASIAAIAQGGYILLDCQAPPCAIIIATGSEVALAVTAAQQLTEQGRAVRVVSMPSTDRFQQQSLTYQQTVLPVNLDKRVAVEAGGTDFWYRYVGLQGVVIGIDHFGASAPAALLFDAFGLTSQAIVSAVNKLVTD